MAAIRDLSLLLKAKLFRGLADPSRLAILETLRSGEKIVSEIVAATGLSQPNASAHLACLRDCGLVSHRQEGRNVFYALKDARMETLIQTAEGVLSGVSERLACCPNYACQIALKCAGDAQCFSFARISSPSVRRRATNIGLPPTRSSRKQRP